MINATINAMKKGMLIVFALLLGVSAANAQDKGLFFSEYIEGSSNNKALEIYNPTADTVWLSGYAFPNVSNDPATVGEYEFWNSFPDTAYIIPGDVYVIAHGSADPTILAEADYLFNFLSNGDDGFALVKGNEESFEFVDWLGSWDGDPGSGWDVAGVSNGTQNHTLVRKQQFESGNTVPLASFGSNAAFSEWIVYDVDDFTYLGSHTVDEVEFSIRELNRYRELTEFSVAGIEDHPLAGVLVEFTAVIVSYPKSSGLANPVDDPVGGEIDRIGRIHVFVTDTSAVTRGRAGMSLQIVESDYTTIDQFTRGDVVTFTGRLGYFNATAQFDVESVNLLGSVNEEFSQYAELLNPWDISVSDLNDFTNGALSMKIDSYSAYIGSYVKFTSAIVSNVSFSDRNSGGRSDWALNQDGSRIYIYDTSLRLRNDHAIGSEGYLLDYNARRLDDQDGEFVPPSAGANVDVSGFISYNSDDPDGLVPSGNGALSINPMEDGVVWLNNTRFVDGQDLGGGATFSWPNDIIVNGLPPVVSNAALSDSTVTSADQVTVTVDAEAVEGATLTSVVLIYNAGATSDTLDMVSSGGIGYSVQLPAFPNFTPVSFYIEAADDNGLTGRGPFSGNYGFFVTDDILSSLSFLQKTGDEQPGDSPLAGAGPVPVNITATVTTSAGLDGFITIQDRSALWSGVFVTATNGADALNEGDQIAISELEVSENFGVTEVSLISFTNLNSPNTQMDTLAVEAITQDVRANYEPYEGLLVMFNDVKVTTNQADGGSDFGEWEFGSRQGGGAADTLEVGQGLRFDDRSSRFSSSVNEHIKIGAQFESLTAIGYFSFSNPKMVGGNPDFFVSDDVTFPFSGFDLESPADEAEVVVTSDIVVDWEATTDFDGNSVTYEWVLYSADTSEVIARVPSDNNSEDTQVTLPFATVDALLASASLNVGDKADFVWNVRVSDGVDTVAVSTGYDISTNSFTPLYYSINLERGLNVGNEPISGVPTKFGLEQNYPNPFNPSTNINFSLPENSKVTLAVYDMLGRKVATLLDNTQLNAAIHSVKFDASALASGMYIYRIEAGSFTSIRKMMLIK